MPNVLLCFTRMWGGPPGDEGGGRRGLTPGELALAGQPAHRQRHRPQVPHVRRHPDQPAVGADRRPLHTVVSCPASQRHLCIMVYSYDTLLPARSYPHNPFNPDLNASPPLTNMGT